ncbi:GAF domain-containing protein [Croceivirga thetidis]|uniref:GAF domain-containing protein n=1 Tax=Croceivirga thetidis TaxID=2721623 RepID=A0ABX1GRD3_9FLAO|nr:GAF domain-containing protein [Croceivirga thetidis]NKI31615.1 GAF domain-containing protein [Croceivirga thetidis]
MGNKGNNQLLPFVQLISFNKLLNHYEEQAKSKSSILAERAKAILKAAEPYPELRDGFDDLSIIEKRKDVIETILADTFAPALTKNEIKTASIPYFNLVFNPSERFQKILEEAGKDFVLEMREMPEDVQYIMMATVVLGFFYGYNLDFKRPIFYDIPDKNGVMRHYRVLYNADFMELIANDNAKELTKEDVNELLEDSDNIDLWKEKIPPYSFTIKGFVICNMFDVTAEHSISEIKSTLIGGNKREKESFMVDFQETFRSLFNLRDISVGFSGYEETTNRFFKIYGKGIESFVLNNKEMETCDAMLCDYSYGKLIGESSPLAISNVERYYKKSQKGQPYKNLYEQGFRSAILAPIADEGKLLGILEIVSPNIHELNGINATKLEDVMPFIVSAVLRSIEEEQNLIDAIIQHECTTVHESVYWKFQEEAKKFMAAEAIGEQPSFNEIVFQDIYPLYGQIDIKDSSKERNLAIQRDLIIQLSEIQDILKIAHQSLKLPIYEELMFRVNNHMDEIKDTLFSNSEQAIFDFVHEEINPVFHHLKREDKVLGKQIALYEEHINSDTESYYDHRKNYDESVMKINMKLAALLDRKQEEAQEMFPHYFERYKTDGVEHNMYIGSEIANSRKFDQLYLNNLRLWQLQTMVEMENKHYKLKPHLPVKLDVASLLLVYSTPLAIRFRMDEKRFDVDGTYNARYEIIKKRIDKSYIKGTNERLTQKGKLAIVYSQKKDEKEYLRYITFLKSKGYFTNNIEVVELEGLQGVTGLKAIRAEILYKTDEESEKTYTYDDLMEALEA